MSSIYSSADNKAFDTPEKTPRIRFLLAAPARKAAADTLAEMLYFKYFLSAKELISKIFKTVSR